MRALLLGSIGSVAETSELQREAFNLAFEEHGLDWHWDRETYRALLASSGGRARIRAYALHMQRDVDIEAIHRTKTAKFQAMLDSDLLPLRTGVIDAIRAAREAGCAVGFVTGTEQATAEKIAESVAIDAGAPFDVITHRQLGLEGKPRPALYLHALDALGLGPTDALAIEDNPAGVRAATSAGLTTIAFPGENTTQGDYEDADEIVRGDIGEAVRRRLGAPPAASSRLAAQ